MRTASSDKDPFILLPVQPETAWRRLIRLTFGILNRLQHQQRAVQGVTQGSRTNSGASQISDLYRFTGGLAVSGLNSAADNKANVYQAHDVSEVRSNLKGYNWPFLVGQGNQVSADLDMGVAGIAHDGSCKFFTWDNAKGCMVPFKPSTPLKQRFKRSFDAFMQSWRLG